MQAFFPAFYFALHIKYSPHTHLVYCKYTRRVSRTDVKDFRAASKVVRVAYEDSLIRSIC